MKARLAILVLAFACATTTPHFIDGPQGRLHVDDGGPHRGLPILFVHGNGGRLSQWRNQLAYFRQSCRAVAFDLRGMGESEAARNGDYSLAAMSDDVEAVADALHLNRFVIVGHSYGGAVVATYAAKHPERVAGVIYADAGGTVKMTDEAATKFLNAIRANKDRVVAAFIGPVLAPGTEATRNEVMASMHDTALEPFIDALISMRTFDASAVVNAYPGPKLAIAAAAIENPASLHVQVPSLPVVKMAGVSHWLMLDKPDEFNRIVDEFVSVIPSVARNLAGRVAPPLHPGSSLRSE